MATSSGDCASRLSRRNVIGDAVCSLMRRHSCVIAQIVATTSSGLMTPAPSNHSSCCPLCLHQRTTKTSVLSLRRANRLCSFFLTAPLYVSILDGGKGHCP